ncbi:MAG: hypothetical protein GY809_08050 [Planctomycetes bacterium]|nr:hypothetical protein [Planctomycetota bacterium]
MKQRAMVKVVLVSVLLVSFALPVAVSAQPRTGRGGLYGDWRIKMAWGDREFESILAFSRNQDRQYTGSWISAWGVNELKDVTFEDNTLTFTQVMRFNDQENTSKFTGTIEQGELSGQLVSDRGETQITGKRAPRTPRGVGSWAMTIQAGEREYTGVLSITADPEGNLIGMWKSERGEGKLQDVKYENRTLTYTRVIEREGNRMELAFEGTLSYTSLEGSYKGEGWEAPATGKRIGAEIMGTWNLDIESERGARKQRLRINPDMSALYGSNVIKKITLDGDTVRFKYTMTYNDQDYEISFEGKVAETKLTGEVTTSRGTSKVTGTKRVFRRPGTSRN